MATLTYVYADSTAVLGPLATSAEPHGYDLCTEHSARLTAPRGWDVVRLDRPSSSERPAADDLEALANAVRDVAARTGRERRGEVPVQPEAVSARRSHLRAVPSAE